MAGTVTSNPNNGNTIIYNGRLVQLEKDLSGKTYFTDENGNRRYVDLSSPTWFADVIRIEADNKKQELKKEAHAQHKKYTEELNEASKARTLAYRAYRYAVNLFNLNETKYNELVNEVDGEVDRLSATEQKEAEGYQLTMKSARKDKLNADIDFAIAGFEVNDAIKMKADAGRREIALG